ncbi:MAG: hypothetical protein ABSB79_15830 [Syntrophales bacterium]
MEMLAKRMESVIGVGLAVKLVAPNSLPRQNGKPIRVIDNRKP